MSQPIVSTVAGTTQFVTAGSTTLSPVVVDAGLTISGATDATLLAATVSIANLHGGEDVLSFTNDGASMGNIAGSYDGSTGVLTLTSSGATATAGQFQAALRSVTYGDTATSSASTETRSVAFAVDDGTGLGASATRAVAVTVDSSPRVVTDSARSVQYIDNAAPTAFEPAAHIADTTGSSAVGFLVFIKSGYQSGDTLSFTNTDSSRFGDIAVVGGGNGYITVASPTGSASTAQVQAAIDAVTFATSSGKAGARTIAYYYGDQSSYVQSANADTIVVRAPTLTTDPGSASFVAADNGPPAPVAVDAGLALVDDASATVASATVAITGNRQSGEDVLAFANDGTTMGNVAGAYDASAGTLTLTSAGSTATLAQFQAALRAVTYADNAVTPNTATRTISYALTDAANAGTTAARTVTVASTDQTPIVATSAGTPTHVRTAAPAIVDAAVAVGDRDNTTLASATVSVVNGVPGDTLAFNNTNASSFGDIAASYDPASQTLSLSSSSLTATTAQFQAALDAVTFATSSSTIGPRAIAFAVSDGTKTSQQVQKTVQVLAGPVVQVASAPLAFVAADNAASTPVAVDPTLTLTDDAAATLTSATVTISGSYHSGQDILSAALDGATMGNIVGSFDAATGRLVLSSAGATATLAQFQAALRSVTYTDTAITPDPATRTLTVAVDDGTSPVTTATRAVTVADTEQTPLAAGSGTALLYLNSAGAVIDRAVHLSDRDNTTLASARVSIASGFAAGDVLALGGQPSSSIGNIAASYDAATGILTLTSSGATATLAQWQAALDAVTFASSSAATGIRTISFAVSDGIKGSTPFVDAIGVIGSVTSGSAVVITSNVAIANRVTLPPGPLVIAAPAGFPANLSVQGGGTLSSGAIALQGIAGITLGSLTGTSGVGSVSGASSVLDANGARITIGDAGAGSLTVAQGGTVRAGARYADGEAALAVGASVGGSGSVVVTGAGSQLVIAGSAVIGGTNTGNGVTAGGHGDVVVSNGGTLTAQAVTVQAGSTLTVDAASTLNATALTLQGGTADLQAVGSTMPITFGANGTLRLHALSPTASLNGFGFGNTIDLVGITTAQTGLISGISSGTDSMAVNTAQGVNLYASDDGHGGTIIQATSQTVGVYRFFESGSGVQFFTTSADEARTIMQTRTDLVFEGQGTSLVALTPGNGDPNAHAVYRFFDKVNGTHFYTVDANERDSLIANRSDLVYEANSGLYEHLTPQPGDTPVYRFFNSVNGSHFYTDNPTERATILSTRPDLVAEGISFYEAPHT